MVFVPSVSRFCGHLIVVADAWPLTHSAKQRSSKAEGKVRWPLLLRFLSQSRTWLRVIASQRWDGV